MTNHFHFKYFSRNNMKRQLITLFICAILIPVVCIGAVLGLFTYRRTTVHYEDLAYSQSKVVHSTIVSTSIYLHSTYETVVNSSRLQELLCTDDPGFDSMEATAELTDLFDKSLTNTAMLTTLRLYIPTGLMENVEPNKYILPFTDEVTSSHWYQKASEISGNFWTSDIRTGQNDVNYWELHYCCRIPIPRKNTYGILVMSVSNDYLRNLISNKNYQIYMNVNEEPVFLSSDRSYAGQEFPLDMGQEPDGSRTGIFTLFEEKVIGSLETVNLYHSPDKLHIFVADTSALDTTQHLLMIFLLITLLALLISAVIIFLYATYFSGRINTLRLAMAKVSNNDYEIVDNIRGDDELTATFHDMKLMVEKLKSAEARLYQSQIHEQMIENQQQQMELKLLANQINPHFLYNTLDLINWIAMDYEAEDIEKIAWNLARFYRLSLNHGQDLISIGEEVEHVQVYVNIQKFHYDDAVHLEAEVPEELKSLACLNIILQPFVENAILHGIGENAEIKQCRIAIRVQRQGEDILFTVRDDGPGMTQQQMEDAVSLNISQIKGGYGIKNINFRIKLCFGEEYGVRYESVLGEGTTAFILIPAMTMEEAEAKIL